MRISGAFPSDYLKAADLQGRSVRVQIDRIEMKDIGGDHKPVLFFQGKEKGMVLNKTNSGNIANAYGDETDDWTGAEIELFEAMVDFQGKTVPAIRVRVPPRKPVRNDYPTTAPGIQSGSGVATTKKPSDDFNDDIPF